MVKLNYMQRKRLKRDREFFKLKVRVKLEAI